MAPATATATSSRAADGGYGRISTAAATLRSDFESLMADVRKGLVMIKSVATDLEKENRSDLVSELEEAAIGLLDTSDDCSRRAAAVKAVGDSYCAGEEPTNFKKLMEEELAKIRKDRPSTGKSNPFIRQFKEAVWDNLIMSLSHVSALDLNSVTALFLSEELRRKPAISTSSSGEQALVSEESKNGFKRTNNGRKNVHHAGQPMPGEELEDIVMTNTQCNLLNTTCPLSGKPVTGLEEPVRNMECKHVYEKKAVMIYIQSSRTLRNCPVAGCPKQLFAEKVYCDGMLLLDIEEMRSRSHETAKLNVVEDFTMLDED